MTNWQLIRMFVNGQLSKNRIRANNLTIQNYDDYIILYSYSAAIGVYIKKDNLFLVNSHRYSHTTSVHKSSLRYLLYTNGKNYLELDFPLLYSAGIYPENIKVLDVLKVYNDDYANYLPEFYILLSANRNIEGEFFFLYGIDKTLKTYSKDFICELPNKANTVREALSLLNPIPETERSINFYRQGDYFFKEIGNSNMLKKLINEKFSDKLLTGNKIKSLKTYAVEQMAFPEWQAFISNSHHQPSKIIVLKDGIVFCQGTVKHSMGEHYVLHLKKNIWYQMLKNTAVRSWTAGNTAD